MILISCKQKETDNDSKIIENKEENVVSDKSSNCELKTLITINSLLEKDSELNDQNYADFFANMSPECSNNIEYTEFNNELFFKMLESNPEKFIESLRKESKKKEILEFVLTQLQNPINDGIELKEIHQKLDETIMEDNKIKELVSESIDIAIEKYK